ncbi:MAG: DUF4032 domain-containing protein [Ilumatobacteraceae bacterium]
MRLQLAHPGDHQVLLGLDWDRPLDDWSLDDFPDPGGMHRHVVRYFEHGPVTYVLKELPTVLAQREYRLLRALADLSVPTATAIGVITERGPKASEGVLVTRHIDFSIPYRVLLAGRGLQIPYLGERMLDALVSLLVRLHLNGFFWGDCSLNNTLFRRDAGALTAFVIDLETGELHHTLTDGQRELDLTIAVENVAGGLFDLQAMGRLADGIDPLETALAVEQRYEALWAEITDEEYFRHDEMFRVEHRVRRLAELGFDLGELDVEAHEDVDRIRIIPRVVEYGFHAPRLMHLTGLTTGENQARRLLSDISQYKVQLELQRGRRMSESLAAARWLDEIYSPTIDAVPAPMAAKLEPAELFHQILEHRWFLSEQANEDVGMEAAVASYVDTVLPSAPDEQRLIDPPTMELPIIR